MTAAAVTGEAPFWGFACGWSMVSVLKNRMVNQRGLIVSCRWSFCPGKSSTIWDCCGISIFARDWLWKCRKHMETQSQLRFLVGIHILEKLNTTFLRLDVAPPSPPRQSSGDLVIYGAKRSLQQWEKPPPKHQNVKMNSIKKWPIQDSSHFLHPTYINKNLYQHHPKDHPVTQTLSDQKGVPQGTQLFALLQVSRGDEDHGLSTRPAAPQML